MPDLIPYTPEFRQNLFRGSGQLRRIVETDMDSPHSAEEEGALLVGGAAESDDVVELLSCELIKRLGAMAGDVDLQFRQNLTGQGVDLCRLGAGGKRLETVAQVEIDQPFGHL